MSRVSVKQLRSKAKRLREQGKLIPALISLDQIVDRGEAGLEDWRTMGVLLSRLGEFAQALGAFEHALELNSGDVESIYELGRSLYQLGDLDQSLTLIEKVAEKTQSVGAWRSLATLAPGAPAFTNQRVNAVRQRYADLIRTAEEVTEDVSAVRDQDRAAKSVMQRDTPNFRIAYLSAHWNNANYMKPVWPMINHHDLDRFEIHLLDDSETEDSSWSWLTNNGVHQHCVSHLSNAELAEFIRDLGIDILVDLSAYSAPERLGVFVHRSAPIQVAWFNSFATNGFREIDYIVGDRAVIRSDEQIDYTEQMVALPLSYLTFQTNHRAPDIGASPFAQSGRFTFGCLGPQYKITPPVYDAWCSILSKTEGSRLVLANRLTKSPQNQAYVREQFKQRKIDPARIEFMPPANHYDFLKHYDGIDLTLDTFPYNGGTTTMESIWQGAAVLTFDGDRWASRTSATLLLHSHLSDFVADSVQQYVEKAIYFATDPSGATRLQELRHSMREDLMNSSVCDSKTLAASMEAAFLSMNQK